MAIPRTIWLLDEGSQGHLVQSQGLVRELSKAVSVTATEVPVRSVFSKGRGRSVVKRLMKWAPAMWMFRLLHPGVTLPEKAPDLIVSSGPHSLAALEFLGRFLGCPTVFLQGTLRVPQGAVTVVMRPFEGEHREDYIFIPLLFTAITEEVVREARDSFLTENPGWPQEAVNALFIGNSSAKIRFSREDWQGLVRLVNDLWEKDGRRWLITTSYRTGRELEDLFRRGIRPDAILDAVWYSEAPRKVTKVFLGLAERVFVTMDSLTMLTEAAASGRHVFALCPGETAEESRNTHLDYVRRLVEGGYVNRVSMNGGILPAAGNPPPVDYSQAVDELLERLRWKT